MVKSDKKFGEIIKKARKKRGLTQRSLAKKMEVDPSLVSKWELNQRVPEGRNLIDLALMLDIVPELFPGYEKVREPSAEFSSEVEIKKLQSKVKNLEKNTENLNKIVHLLVKNRFGDSNEFINELGGKL